MKVTIIAAYPRQLYSGMVPDLVAGLQSLDRYVLALAGLRGALYKGQHCRHRCEDVALASGDVVAWDLLSLNTGPVRDCEKREVQTLDARDHPPFVGPIETFGRPVQPVS